MTSEGGGPAKRDAARERREVVERTQRAERQQLAESQPSALRVYAQPQVLAMVGLGFSSGLPFPLVFATLTAWLTTAGVSKSQIGMFAWAGIALPPAVGAVLMALHSVLLFVGNRARLNRIYGPQSLEEEISTEIEHATGGAGTGASRT